MVQIHFGLIEPYMHVFILTKLLLLQESDQFHIRAPLHASDMRSTYEFQNQVVPSFNQQQASILVGQKA